MRSKCVRRADGARVHRTRPIFYEGRHVGHVCPCREALLTENGGQSVATQPRGEAVVVRARTLAHARRVIGASR